MRKTILSLFCILAMQMVAHTNLELAEQALGNDDFNAVIEYTTKQINETPQSTDAYALRCRAYLQLQDYDKALADATLAIKYWDRKSKMNRANVYALRARVYEEMDRYKSALADYNMGIKNDKQNADAYFNRADFYCRMNDYPKAEADYRMAYKMAPHSQFTMDFARCLVGQEKLDEAQTVLANIIKYDPSNIEARQLYATSYYYQENYRALIDNYILYLTQEHGNLNPLLAGCDEEFGYGLKAITDQVMASKEDTDNQVYWLGIRAYVYERKEQYQEALTDLEEIDVLLGDTIYHPFALYHRAICYEGLHEYDKEVRVLTLLINEQMRLEQQYVNLYNYRARAYENCGQFEEAKADYTHVIEADEADVASAYRKRAWVKIQTEDASGALEDLNKTILLDDEDVRAYMLRGQLYIRMYQDTIKARNDFMRVLELDDFAVPGSARHFALAGMGQETEAILWLNKILETYPENAGMMYDAACAYAILNQKTTAISYLERAFELGYRNFNHVESDWDLAAIRDMKEFENLIAKYRGERTVELMEDGNRDD